jgi:hypothetical protein
MDVWAIGCIILYILGNGKLPWQGKEIEVNKELSKEMSAKKDMLKVIKQMIDLDASKRIAIEEIIKYLS